MSRITINSNIASLTAQRNVAKSTAALKDSFARLSSGLRINSAKDDAAGLAIAKSLQVDNRVLSQGIRNANDAVSMLSIAESAGKELSSILIRLRELAEGAANGTQTVENRIASDEESKALVDEYNRIINSTEFNSQKLLDGNLENFRVQLGYGNNGGLNFDIGNELEAARGDFTGTSSASNFASTVPNVVTTGDFDSDGIQDVITFDGSGDAAVFHAGNGDGTFAAGSNLSFGVVQTVAEVVDFNSDGNLDIIFDDPFASGFKIALGDGNAGFTVSSVTTNAINDLKVGDVNGDGVLDVTGLDSVSEEVVTFLGNGAGGVGSGITTNLVGNAYTKFDLGDINNDGILDLVHTGGTTTSHISSYLGNGDGTFSFESENNIGATLNEIALHDFNHDGNLDYFSIGNSAKGHTYLGDGTGSFTSNGSLIYGSGTGAVNIVDLDGDGYKDITVTSQIDNAMYILAGTEDASGTNILSISLGSSPPGASFADFNGDGVLDIATASAIDATLDVFLQGTTDTSELKRIVLLTKEDARQAMSDIDAALERVSTELGAIGAVTSRLSSAVANLQQTTENLGSAQSRIEDADVAFEAAALVRNNILQEAGIAVLAQANQTPALALQLLNDSQA